MADDKAYLSSEGAYTIFSFRDYRLKFAAPYSLERYESVIEWDNGYLVVMAKYAHNSQSEEEYIDLVPILKSLYMQPDDFLRPIKAVEVRYALMSANLQQKKCGQKSAFLIQRPQSETEFAVAIYQSTQEPPLPITVTSSSNPRSPSTISSHSSFVPS